jgi:hypothetical protein
MPARKRRLTAFAVAMAVLIATPLVVGASDSFTDVPDSNVHHDDITWLADSGVTLGCNPPDNTNFCPGDPVLRQQMASFLRRLAENQVVDAATAITAETAGDAETLAGQAPAAYQTIIQADACQFTICTDSTGAIVSNATVVVEAPTDGVLHISASSSLFGDGAGNDFVQLWVAIDQTTNDGCGGWLFAPTNNVEGSYAEVTNTNTGTESSNLASSTAATLAAGTHTVKLCTLSLQNVNYDAASLSTVWSQGGTGLEPASAELSDADMARLETVFEGADLSAIER